MATYQPPPGALRAEPPEPPASPLAARLGAVMWPSFFAVVDPTELAAITWPQWDISREAGYTLGFFMFWACTLSACSFTALLLDPPRRPRREPTAQ